MDGWMDANLIICSPLHCSRAWDMARVRLSLSCGQSRVGGAPQMAQEASTSMTPVGGGTGAIMGAQSVWMSEYRFSGGDHVLRVTGDNGYSRGWLERRKGGVMDD